MTKAEELAHCEKNRERNIRYIRGKIVCADALDVSLIASFIRGLEVEGFSYDEYNRMVETKEETA